MYKTLLIAIVGMLLMCLPVQAQEADASLPEMVGARVSSTLQRARLIVDLSASTEFAIATLEDPRRIAVDVRVSALKKADEIVPAGEGMVSGAAIEMAEQGRARVWLELSSPARVQQAYVLDPFDGQPARLVVDLIPISPEEFTANAEKDLALATTRVQPALGNHSNLPGTLSVETSSRPLVILDPGHGGIDGGAETGDGIKEKDIVFAFAKTLQQLLVEAGTFDVALTRDGDTFLRLEERVALARENKADLFVSIHADYFQQPSVRGTSVYTRDENATDALDKVLADNENQVDIVAGFAVPGTEEEVVSILVDLMRREMRRQAYLAAEAIVGQLQPSVELRKFPVRKAEFLVLQAPDVPSILIELGFLSNVHDSSNLRRDEWRDRVAQAVARGIATYFDSFAQR